MFRPKLQEQADELAASRKLVKFFSLPNSLSFSAANIRKFGHTEYINHLTVSLMYMNVVTRFGANQIINVNPPFCFSNSVSLQRSTQLFARGFRDRR
jgi:hypothetical protein